MKYVYEKEAKLVGNVDKGRLWLLNLHDDWIHDQYKESYIYYGTIYSRAEPFHHLSTSITGYFQDRDTGKWIKVKDGVAFFKPGEIKKSWTADINDLIKVQIKTGVYKRYKRVFYN